MEHWDDIQRIVTLILTTTILVMTYLNSKNIREVHLSINSRMDELLKATRISSHAEGVTEGKLNKNVH